jgi:hydroxyacylglutathione hydrolase
MPHWLCASGKRLYCCSTPFRSPGKLQPDMNIDTASTDNMHVFRIGQDNAGALVRDPATGAVAAIDAGDAAPVLAALAAKNWKLTDIFITHEHGDHVAGVASLKAATGAKVSGPAAAASGAPIDRIIGEGDVAMLGETAFNVWATPGHAPGHIVYSSVSADIACVGDVLFVMGCGRILPGGTAAQLWQSIARFSALPGSMRLITGHDYTLSNARFAAHVDPANTAVAARLKEAEEARANGRFWAVTTLAAERATNPFLRAGEPALAASVGRVGSPAGTVFVALRDAKNSF